MYYHNIIVNVFFNVLCLLYSTLSDLGAEAVLRPQINVHDSGPGPNTATCEIEIRIFNPEVTADVLLLGNASIFDADLFEEVIGDILDLDAVITQIDQINSTHFTVQMFGEQGGVLVSVAAIVGPLSNLSAADTIRLRDLGFEIQNVISNAPTEVPTMLTRVIPVWAVAVIVVINSVIVISALLIIVGILWKRYSRSVDIMNK